MGGSVFDAPRARRTPGVVRAVPTATGCRFSFNDDLVFPYGMWGKVMGFFGERMAKKSNEMILHNRRRLAEA